MAKGKQRRKKRRQKQLHGLAMGSLELWATELEHQEQLKAKIKSTIQEAVRTAAANSRQLMVQGLLFSLSWVDVKRWFDQKLRQDSMEHCRMFRKKQNGQPTGRALLTFRAAESVQAIMQMAVLQPMRGGGSAGGGSGRQHCLQSDIGYKGRLRVSLYIPRQADVADGPLDHEKLSVITVQVGNIGPEGAFMIAEQLSSKAGRAQAKLQGRTMVVYFEREGELYKLELRYKQAAGRMLLHQDGATLSLLCPLSHPPKFFLGKVPTTVGLRRSRIEDIDSGEEPQWERVGDMCAPSQEVWFPPENPVATRVATELGALGACYCYRLVLPYSLRELQGRGKGQLLDKLWKYRMLEEHAAPSTTAILQAPFTTTGAGFRLLDVPQKLQDAAPEVLYSLGCLVSQGFIPPCQLEDAEGGRFCEAVAAEDSEVATEVLTQMLGGRKPLQDPLRRFMEVRDMVAGGGEEESDADARIPRHPPEGVLEVKRVLVTPTRVVGTGVEQESGNRVLRLYRQHLGRFIRVAFGEEDGNRVQGGGGPRPLALYARMRKVLENGVWVGGMHFQFLAFSASQLRDQSCWFFAPIANVTPESIRAGMGDFSSIHVVGKCAARMGQCFSSTVDAADVTRQHWSTIPDVERNGYCFTDGCGTVSPTLALEIAQALRAQGRLAQGPVPTAFQVRFSGVKGMLALDPRLPGRKLCTRPSMKKFASPHPKLEIIRYSGFMVAYLNRPVIQLLGALGVRDTVFMDMQDEMTRELDDMMGDGAAAEQAIGKYRGCIDAAIADALLPMLQAGVPSSDPFVHSVLVVLRAMLSQGLRRRARIRIEDGCCLIGIADVTGALAADEVFVCYQKPGSKRPVVRTGPVLLTKFPAFHIGDVRVLQAVDRPELHHPAYAAGVEGGWDAPVNVLVFSQHGDRPLPNQMAGSDLDGDIYFVSWDSRLFPPPLRRNAPPLDYAAIQPDYVDKVTVSHLKDFFVDFARNDSLGQIANAWVAWADQLEEGAASDICQRLAKLHSQAVDFAKHGKPAVMQIEDRPRLYPDFMEKKDKDSYESSQVLGKMYRKVRQVAATAKRDLLNLPRAAAEAAGSGSTYDPDFEFGLGSSEYEEEVEAALSARHHYECELVRLMNQYGVHSEAELLSGCITKWSHYHKRRDTYDLKMEISNAVRSLWRSYRQEFEAELEGEQDGASLGGGPAPGGSTTEALSSAAAAASAAAMTGGPLREDDSAGHELATLVKASAWYYATYHPDCRREGKVQLFSFAWLVADRLALIKQWRVEQRNQRGRGSM